MRSSSINNNNNNNHNNNHVNKDCDNNARGGIVNLRKQNVSGIPHAHSEGNDLSGMAEKPFLAL